MPAKRRKSPARKTAARKPVARKPAARKPVARKPVARKSATRKPATRKPANRSAAKTSSPQSHPTVSRFQPGDRYYVSEQQRRESLKAREEYVARGNTLGVYPGMMGEAWDQKKDAIRRRGLAANSAWQKSEKTKRRRRGY